MNLFSRFRVISDADKARAVSKLIEDATPDFDFFYLLVLSVLMATFGLLSNSETVVIGSMLIAPIMSPVLALALGLSMSNHSLMLRSGSTLVRATVFAVGAATLAALLFSFNSFGSGDVTELFTITSRTAPSLLSFAIAIVAGLAVSYSLANPHLSATLPGVAVAVALMPPLAVVGVGIAHLSLGIAAGALVMYLVNVAGIVFAAMLTFSLMDVHNKRHQATSKIVAEERRVEREEQKVEQIVNNKEE